MTTIKISDDPKLGARQLNVTLNNVNILYSVDLLKDDGTPLFEGKNDVLQMGQLFINPNAQNQDSDEVKAAKATFLSVVENGFADLYNALNPVA